MEKHFKLECDNELFNKLKDLNNDPNDNWWKAILKDDKLYVNIRKGNKVSVYYKGAAVMRNLHYSKNSLLCNIGKTYRKGWADKKEGEPMFSAEEIVNNLDKIKENIENYYDSYKPKNENDEDNREKKIQGELYTDEKCYIDSEYAYYYSEKLNSKGKKRQIRIDLIKLNDDGMLEFVELKCISDARLLKKLDDGLTSDDPEILEQMEYYKEFIEDCKHSIVPYYKKVKKIMKTIGVRNKLTINGVCEKPYLLIVGYKKREYKRDIDYNRRKERIKSIKNKLEENYICSNIQMVLEEFERG